MHKENVGGRLCHMSSLKWEQIAWKGNGISSLGDQNHYRDRAWLDSFEQHDTDDCHEEVFGQDDF